MRVLSPPSIYIASTSSNLLTFPFRPYTHLRFFPPSLHLSLPHISLPLPVFPFFSNIYKSLNTSLTYSSILLIASAVFPFTILLFFCRPFHSYFPSSFFISPPCPPLFLYFFVSLYKFFLYWRSFAMFSSPFCLPFVFQSLSFSLRLSFSIVHSLLATRTSLFTLPFVFCFSFLYHYSPLAYFHLLIFLHFFLLSCACFRLTISLSSFQFLLHFIFAVALLFAPPLSVLASVGSSIVPSVLRLLVSSNSLTAASVVSSAERDTFRYVITHFRNHVTRADDVWYVHV